MRQIDYACPSSGLVNAVRIAGKRLARAGDDEIAERLKTVVAEYGPEGMAVTSGGTPRRRKPQTGAL